METEASERLLIPSEAIAHVPNLGVSNSPLHTIHSHGDLSEAYSPINNSSQDASSKRKKWSTKNVRGGTAFADRLDRAGRQKKHGFKDSLDDVSFGVDPGIFDDIYKADGKPDTAIFESGYDESYKSEEKSF